MAGMLPGVEAARRRRVHVSSADGGGGATTSRRPSLCLYATNNHEFNLNSHASVERNATIRCDDETTLDAAARESKRRLDLRFQNIRKSKGGEGSPNSKTNLYRSIWKSAYQSC